MVRLSLPLIVHCVLPVSRGKGAQSRQSMARLGAKRGKQMAATTEQEQFRKHRNTLEMRQPSGLVRSI